jgi:hypothetical protein
MFFCYHYCKHRRSPFVFIRSCVLVARSVSGAARGLWPLSKLRHDRWIFEKGIEVEDFLGREVINP